MITIAEALAGAQKQLQGSTQSYKRDTEVLLAFVLQKNRAFLYAHPEKALSDNEEMSFQKLVTLRQRGEPIAYLVGCREFWSLPLKVTNDTLIPRPETELIVDLALTLLPESPRMRILDLGTGSGAIALALAHERLDWQIDALDFSQKALAVAKENADRLHLSHVQFHHSHWFQHIDKTLTFDAILANPPYLAADDPHLKEGDLRFEPHQALVSGISGLEDFAIILKESLARLVPGGLLLVEHGCQQKDAISSMLYDYGYDTITTWQDYQGWDRVSGGRKPK